MTDSRSLVPVADGVLGIEARAEDAPLLDVWLPRAHPQPDKPQIVVRLGPMGSPEHSWLADQKAKRAAFELGPVRAWVDADARLVAMAGREGRGMIDLAAGSAAIDPGTSDDGHAMLTISARLLLTSQRRVLLDGAAVRRPDGGVLLLLGPEDSGKSTTALTLAQAPGWAWLSDEQVVLGIGGQQPVDVFAWARHPKLDAGYERGVCTGDRRHANPRFLATLPWVARGSFAGTLLVAVNAPAPSASRSAPGTAAMEALIRQAGWVMAEPGAARAALEVLSLAASSPAHFLDVGLDSYAKPDHLAGLLDEGGAAR